MPLDDMRLQLTRKVTSAAAAIARDWERELQDTSPVASGRMRQNTSTKVSGSRGRVEVTAIVDTEYAEMVSTGTRPHVITPRSAGGVLSFFWERVGEQVYFASVNHPGATPRTWWTDSIRSLPDLVQRAWRGAR